MRRTKIVCTLGPASERREQIEALLNAGMNVARLNFSHGDHDWHAERLRMIRSLAQARDSYEWGRARQMTFQAVISLAVEEDELVRRLLERGRRSGRSDDNEVTIRNRLNVYNESTRPLLDFYRQRGILIEIDGAGAVEEITARIRAALDPILGLPTGGTVGRLTQANPKGPGQGDVPALLRRVADSLAALGPVDVTDVTFGTEATDDGPWPHLTVYYRHRA